MCRSARTKSSISSSRATSPKNSTTILPARSQRGYGGAFFPLPEPLIQGPATRVMSLRDGSKKMSKSDPSDYSRINLTDDADRSRRKSARRRPTRKPLPPQSKASAAGPKPIISSAFLRPYRRHDKRPSLEDIRRRQFSAFKSALVDLAVAKLGPIGAEMTRLKDDPRLHRRRFEAGRRPRAGSGEA